MRIWVLRGLQSKETASELWVCALGSATHSGEIEIKMISPFCDVNTIPGNSCIPRVISAAQEAETVLRRSLDKISTAAPAVRGCMLMFSGWEPRTRRKERRSSSGWCWMGKWTETKRKWTKRKSWRLSMSTRISRKEVSSIIGSMQKPLPTVLVSFDANQCCCLKLLSVILSRRTLK